MPTSLALPSGARIPTIGFGTGSPRGDVAHDSVLSALQAGYRHIDTATSYTNEAEVGRAIADSGVARSDIFLTTKFPKDSERAPEEVIDASLTALGVDHVNLWLIHWPQHGTAAADVWREFIRIRESGRARDIGVSNYSVAQVDELIAATGVAPAVNQIPWAPSLYDAERLEHAASVGMLIEAYGPLRRSDLDSPVLAEIAAAHHATTAQVILRWVVQHGIVALTSSTKPERIRSNRGIGGLELSTDELAAIDSLAA